MARKRTSLVEDVVAIVAKLPWWLGLVLAVLSYLLLHKWAGQPVGVSTQPGQMGVSIVRGVGQTFAGYGH